MSNYSLPATGALIRLLLAIAGCAAPTILSGCAASAPGYESAPPPATSDVSPSPTAGGKNVVGVWDGTTLANCATSLPSRCNAQQRVTLTLLRGDSSLIGFYSCAYGNINCYNMNQTGKVVKGSVNGNQITARVQMPDGTSCIFTGRSPANDLVGGYSCYGGGSLIESGTWRAHRQY